MDVEYSLQGIQFEWDSEKAESNLIRHGVSFESACESFFDPLVHLVDEEVVDGELREAIIGMTRRWNVLFTVYTVRLDDRFRIISARQATPAERQQYEDQ